MKLAGIIEGQNKALESMGEVLHQQMFINQGLHERIARLEREAEIRRVDGRLVDADMADMTEIMVMMNDGAPVTDVDLFGPNLDEVVL